MTLLYLKHAPLHLKPSYFNKCIKKIRIEQIDQNLVQSQHELNPLDDWQSQSMYQNRNDCG